MVKTILELQYPVKINQKSNSSVSLGSIALTLCLLRNFHVFLSSGDVFHNQTAWI